MAKKSKKQEEFENVRNSLLDKINGEASGGDDGFISSGDESFDELRRTLLTKYATDQRKPVRLAPDYRKPAQNGVQQRKPGETVAPFASQRAWEDYYRKHAEGGKSPSLPKAGTTLPKGETKKQEGDKKKGSSFGSTIVRALAGAGQPGYNGLMDASFRLATDTGYKEPTKEWSDKEREVYEALKIHAPDKADRFAIETNDSINKEKQLQERQQAQKFGREHKALAWGGNTASGVLGFGMGDYLATGLEQIARGEVVEKPYATPRQLTEAASAGASAQINEDHGVLPEKIPVIGGKGWGEVYQLTQSIAQSMALANATGSIGKAGAFVTDAVFFGNAAASAFDDAKERGATDEQAYLFATANGLNEALGEHLSIENLITMKNPHTLAQLAKSILTQAGVEGSEEVFTSFLNNWADHFIMKDKSAFHQAVDGYIRDGMNEQDARKRAWLDMANDMAFDFVGGFFSGGVSGGAQSSMNYITSNTYANRYYRGSQQELTQEAAEVNPGSRAAAEAQRYIDRGKNVPGRLLSQMVEENDSTIQRETVKQRLAELGETGDIESLTDAILDSTSEEGAGWGQRREVKNSQFGSQVLQELKDQSIYGLVQEEAENAKPAQEENREAEDDLPFGGYEEATSNHTRENTATEKPGVPEAAPVVPEAVPGEAGQEARETGPTIAEIAKKYTGQEKAVEKVFAMEQRKGGDAQDFATGFDISYQMGASGVPERYLDSSSGASLLSPEGRRLAYRIGADNAKALAARMQEENNAARTDNSGWRRGTVRAEGITLEELRSSFNDQQNRAYKFLSATAEATGVNVVLYRSQADEKGNYQGAQGRFERKSDTVYIDVQAGLQRTQDMGEFQKYVMGRTFTHEFTHFIEKWNPVQYNELRELVFQKMTENGEDVDRMIDLYQSEDRGGMTYEQASREVVAEAMTDIFPETGFVQKIAQEHRGLFAKLVEKIKEFAANLKSYFEGLGESTSQARAVKQQVGENVAYFQEIVQKFDEAAKAAVENYQATMEAEAEQQTAEETQKAEEQTEAALKAQEAQEEQQPQEQREPQEKKPQEPEEKAAPEKKAADRYDRITGMLGYGHEYLENGFRFAVEDISENSFRGVINKYESAGGVPIFDGRAFYKETFESRDEAVQAVTDIARQYKLLEAKAAAPQRKAAEKPQTGGQNNGKKTNHQPGVLEPESHWPGTARLLDEQQAQNVPGDGGERKSAGTAAERGGPDRRDGTGPSQQRDESGRGLGDRESGDLRGDVKEAVKESEEAEEDLFDDVNPEEIRKELEKAGIVNGQVVDPNALDNDPFVRQVREDVQKLQPKKESLRETVSEQIQQKSTPEAKGSNFTITEELGLADGPKGKYRDNVAALRLLKQLTQEGRLATAEEQAVLAKYVGWGGLDGAFGEARYSYDAGKWEMVPKNGWTKEFQELRSLVEEGVITQSEYEGMRGSTKNAHYTSIEVVRAMYDGLDHLGFQGGRMLEPASGVGNFVGAMPQNARQNVQSWTMVELDRVTGQIAKNLYPKNDVRIQGFQEANLPDNFYDVAIGNVPFGDYGVVDRKYPKRITKAIHNYFFAKSLDKVRPGGIVMFITSSFTMNGTDQQVRRYIMDRADLLGAVRLPETAFSGNAGTEVVTDILVLRKRDPGTAYSGEAFLEATGQRIGNSYPNVNEYFQSHPEMVLGTAYVDRGMYGASTVSYKPLEGRGSLGDQIREAFSKIEGKMTYQESTPEKAAEQSRKASRKPREGAYRKKTDGSVVRVTDGAEQAVDGDRAKRISGMLDILDAYQNLADRVQSGQSEAVVERARKNLNQVYDRFVKANGYLNDQANRNAIAEDSRKYLLMSLENYQKGSKGNKKLGIAATPASATKADIFSKNTIKPNKTVQHADNVADGLVVSMNTKGCVDPRYIAQLTGRTEEQVQRELIDSRMAFKTRDGTLKTPEQYLSGNVRAKLREAEALAPMDSDFQNNVEELRKVVPKDVTYDQIFVAPGASWVPASVYGDFIAHMIGGTTVRSWGTPDIQISFSSTTGEYHIEAAKGIKAGTKNTQVWGTKRRTFLDLFRAMLGNGNYTVCDTEEENGKKTSVVNRDETEAAQAMADKIKEEFSKWLWSDQGRREELTKLYNETFNAFATPKYDGSSLTVNGMNGAYSLRPHQADAVKRIISSGGNTLLAHKVGAGKTMEMAAAAMKLRELGIVKKPAFVVPKSLVAQWGTEFKSYFPAAKLLVASDDSFSPGNRRVFTNAISNGDFDAVILSYEQFGKVPMSGQYQQQFYQEQIDEVLSAIAEEKAENGGKSLTVKQMEKKAAQLKKKMGELAIQDTDSDNVTFENLGIDALFVDEAHNFKNLAFTTKMQNVAGLGNSKGTQRAFDLYSKVRYLQELNGGRGIVFATATPVMNSMAEMYIMQKYLQGDLLKKLGIYNFDSWAKLFGEVRNEYEIKPSGSGVRQKQVFSRFNNLSELQMQFRSFADVLTDVPGLKIPKMKGGKVQIVECEPGSFQKGYMAELEKRANNVKNVDPSVDNMLKITSDGRKVSYTQRMIDPSLPYEPGCKILRCCENILEEYRNGNSLEAVDGRTGKKTAYKGTQIVFLDMATPKGKSKTETETDTEEAMDTQSAKLYEDMRRELVRGGIPAEEIAFIHEADTDAKRKQLFADMNSGKVRVLLGSTGKMGVGMNAQRCVTAIHHLDAPWRPGDVEQRDGRAFRQGNLNDQVTKYTYVTKGSFDARLWDILDRKQGFINQIMNGDDVGRNAEDTGDVTLSAAEVKAIASGNPLIKESVELTDDISKLNSLKRAHDSETVRARTKHLEDGQRIAQLEDYIRKGQEDLSSRKNGFTEETFAMEIGGKKYTVKKEAGAALMAAIAQKATEQNKFVTVGSFAGFDLMAMKSGAEYHGILKGQNGYRFNVYTTQTTQMVGQVMKTAANLDATVEAWQKEQGELQADRALQEELMNRPFEQQEELDRKRRRYEEVMAELNPEERQISAEDTQEQRRTETLSDREVLAAAADRIDTNNLTEGERKAYDTLQSRLKLLEKMENKRAELGKTYRQQQFGADGATVDRSAAEKTRGEMRRLDSQIAQARNDVLDVEQKSVLRDVLKQARGIVAKEQRTRDDEKLARWRDRRNNAAAIKKYREAITRDVQDMTAWVMHPGNKDNVKHIPDVLKSTVIPFLNSIDLSSKRLLSGKGTTIADRAFLDNIQNMKSAVISAQEAYGQYSGYMDLPPDFMETMDSLVKTVSGIVESNSGEYVVNQMTAQELRELSHVVKTVKSLVKNFNRFHSNAMYQHVYEAGNDTIDELRQYESDRGRTAVGEAVNSFVMWEQMRPAYAFERFGQGGKAIFDGFRRGQSKLAFLTNEILDFARSAYTEQEVREWEKKVLSIDLEDGSTVKMKVSQAMSFYCLYHRQQGRGHLEGNGIRVASFMNGKTKQADTGHVLTQGDIMNILDALTLRQRTVARNLQTYMAEKGGQWGNEVSVKRFGERQFTDKQYFPINSDGRLLEATADENPSNASLYALLNMSFSKELTKNANNRVVLYSIFDVFSNHMASMAQYNAFSLPVLDALKWFNYSRTETVDGVEVKRGVREEMSRVYGTPEESRPGKGKQGYAERFVIGIIRAYNGTETHGSSDEVPAIASLRRYNMAQIAYNTRVVIQQPMAITRAAMILSPSSLFGSLASSPATVKANIAEMKQYSGIAAWKELGFYDTNISRGLTDIIKHDNNRLGERIREIGMSGAEAADTITWAAMWNASKKEALKRHKELKPNSKQHLQTAAEIFEDVVYKTQVVDSVLTKNAYLRDKNPVKRALGSFMSEPTTTASMVSDAYFRYRMDMQRGLSIGEAWNKNKNLILRTTAVYSIGAIMLAAVQAVVDAWRDDDEEKDYWEKYKEAFIGNVIDELMIFNKLPVMNTFYELAKSLLGKFGVDTYGNAPSSVIMQWWEPVNKAAEIVYNKFGSGKTSYTNYAWIYKLLQTASGMTGLPLAPVTREVVCLWNSTVGTFNPDYRIRTYETETHEKIRKAASGAGIEKGDWQDYYKFFNEAKSDDSSTRRDKVLGYLQTSGLTAAQQNALFTASGYGGDTADEVYNAAKSYGIPSDTAEAFVAFLLSAKSDDNSTKKDKVLDFIHKTGLSAKQKDALYKAAGYSEKTISKAPWH